MSNANALELLPPRQTAEPAKSTGKARKPVERANSRDPQPVAQFKSKLAKKLNALQAVATVPGKPAPKQASTSAPAQAQGQDQAEVEEGTAAEAEAKAKPTPSTKVSLVKVTTDAVEDIETGAAKPAKVPKAASVAATHSNVPDQAVVKKPADHKTASSAPGKTPEVTANVVPQAANAANKADGDPEPAKATTDGDSDSAAVDGITPATNSFYGSGKVVAKADEAGAATADATTAAQQADAADQVATAAVDPSQAVEPAAGVEQSVSKASPHAGLGEDAASTALPSGTPEKASAGTAALKSGVAVESSPQARFVEVNQPKIISGIQGQLLPHGGTMQIRLDPPELGPMQVSVHMKDGVMTASFETTSEHATRLLSHSLSQLKAGLEAAGVHVEKLQVQQSTKRDAHSDPDGDSGSAPQEQQQQAQQERQRREMVQRMWRKLAGGDPVDLMA